MSDRSSSKFSMCRRFARKESREEHLIRLRAMAEEKKRLESLSMEFLPLMVERDVGVKTVAELQKLFDEIDVSGDGVLEKKEFFQLLDELHFTNDILKKRTFELFDANKDGSIDLSEFIGMMVFFLRGSVEEKLRLTYKAYDLDGDGCLNDFEVEKIIMSGLMLDPKLDYTTEEVDDLVEECMNKLDINGDGMIEYHEFRRQCLKDPILSEVLGKVLLGVTGEGDHIQVS